MTPAHKCERKLIAKLTRSRYRVPYLGLTCTPNHALLHYVFRGQGAPSGTLISRKRNQFISISVYILVYQPCSFACILVFFLADKVSSRSYVRKLTSLSLAFLCLFYVYFTVFWDRRSLQIRYVVFFQHGFKC